MFADRQTARIQNQRVQRASGLINPSLTEIPLGAPAELSLSFAGHVSPQVRARMSYAFRIFAAIYNYKVVDASSNSSRLRCVYGSVEPGACHPDSLFIPARYQARPLHATPNALLKYRYAGEDLYLAFGIDEASGNPDWLAEIFEWLSSGYERSAAKRDSIGRIPFSETVFGRQRITPRKPYASMLMAWMESALRKRSGVLALPKAPSPVPGVEHIVLCSHDIDYYYTSKSSAFFRLLKNLGISCCIYRSPSGFADNSKQLLELLGGHRVGHYLPALTKSIEQCGFRSTFFVVCRRGHRRDPNYQLGQIAADLVKAAENGFSVGVHGSYRSIIEDETLAAETQALAKALGKSALGGRQHWLRFGQHEKLFREIERAGLIFDSTLGFAETVGFRNGASFAFPPYDFEKEAPCRFLEFPLVLMDGNIEAGCRLSGEKPQDVADEVLSASRKWGWGGIAVLWHNPIEPISVPREVNRVFWTCARKQSTFREKWMSSDQFLKHCLNRYQNAGLLENLKIDA